MKRRFTAVEMELLAAFHAVRESGEGWIHGYELVRRLRAINSNWHDVAHATVYRALLRLESQSLLESQWKATNGPARRVYRIVEGERC